MGIVTLRAQDGSEVRFDEATLISKGGMKDVYFSPDRSYVVAFYRDPMDYAGHERLKAIVGLFRTNIYERDGGDYWKDLMCWPTRIVDHAGRTGIVVPAYDKTFFFKHGSVNGDMLGIKGQEKEGKWFASAKNQFKFIAPEERGDWLRYRRSAWRSPAACAGSTLPGSPILTCRTRTCSSIRPAAAPA